MRAELISVGDELCRGEILNSNAKFLASALWELQITVQRIETCGDIGADMRRAIDQAASNSDLVLISGGLGPTSDDLTVDLLAEMVEEPVVIDPASAEYLKKRFAEASMKLGENMMRQVRHPANARVFQNPVGLAPAFEVILHNTPVICLPGPPREVQAIFETHLHEHINDLRSARGEKIEHVCKRTYRVFGRGESDIATRLRGFDLGPQTSLHYQVKFPETLVKIVVRSQEAEAAAKELRRVDLDLRQRLGALVYGVDSDSLAGVLGRELIARQETLATAESCTGGLIGSLLTAIPGSSEYYLGGGVTYVNAEKSRQLGVRETTLTSHGAVSEPVVLEMAEGIRKRTGSSWGVAVSGIAGPGGGTEDKPVGTVWIAVAGPSGRRYSRKYHWPSTRDRVRLLTAYWALNAVRLQMREAQEQEEVGRD